MIIYEIYFSALILIIIGTACTIFKSNLIKKIIGLSVFGNGIHLFLISIGYRNNSIPPIVTPKNIGMFSLYSVDPLPQALVLTSIVIDLSVTTLGLIIVVYVYRRFGSINSKNLKTLKG